VTAVIDFPTNPAPTNGDTYTPVNGITYTYQDGKWNSIPKPGYTGSKGEIGYSGSQGNTGPQGVSVNILGSVATTGNLPGTGQQAGDAWIVAADGDMYFWDVTLSTWDNIGKIVGYAGSKGDTGANGADGYTGSRGNNGSNGFTGSAGTNGSNGFTGSAGTNGFTGSAGTNGSNGFTGSAGTNGFTGSAGTNGFTGSAGTNGFTGSAGTNGSNGFTGSAGTNGFTGSASTVIGYTGSQGVIGFTGSQGVIGYTGSQGVIGYSGSQGVIGYSGSLGYTGSFIGDASTITTGTLSNSRLASVPNTALANSKVTIGTTDVSLGATATTLAGLDSISATSITVNGQPTTYGTVSPDYIQVEKSADQSSVAKNADINFNVTTATNGGIAYASNIFTLTAGKTYLLETTLCTNNFTSSSAFIWYSWVDATTNAQLDTSNGAATSTGSSGVVVPATWTANDNYSSSARLIYTPNTNQTVKIRATDGSGTCTVLAIGTRASITQLNPKIAVQATATGTVATNYAKYTRTASQSVSANSVIICNISESTSGTAISVNTSTGQSTLIAGKTYRLRGTIGTIAGSTAASTIGYGWYNETTSAWIGEGAGWSSPSSTNWTTTTAGTAEYVFTPSSTTVVSFRVISVSNVTSIGGNQSDFAGTYANPWIDIEEIGASFALNALATITTTSDVSVGGNLTVTGGIRKSARVLTTTTTLTTSDASGFIEFAGSGTYTVTLPDPTQAANSGIGYRFWQNTTSNITLSTPAGAFYGPSGSSTSTKVLAQATTQYWDVWSDGYNWAVFGIKIA
jgi:collagen type VII alpha